MTLWKAALLGIIQGLTEFLPISSSGHLVIGQHLLDLQEPEMLFDVGVHFATLIAVLIYFRREIFTILSGFFKGDDKPARNMGIIIIIGTIPAVLVGLLFSDLIETAFSSPKMASVMLIVTGLVLISTARLKKMKRNFWEIKWHHALIVGVAQAIAILPGISRSGATISASLHLGISSEDAARFSFILSLPAIFGAALFEARKIAAVPVSEFPALIVGMLAAGIVGYLAIAVMLKIVSRGKLYYFAPYCILLASIILLTL